MKQCAFILATVSALVMHFSALRVYGQDTKVQTDSLRSKETVQDLPATIIRTGDTTRWDERIVYAGGHFEVMDGGYQADAGVGLHLRIPILRFGNESELFLRGAYTFDWYSLLEAGVGFYPIK